MSSEAERQEILDYISLARHNLVSERTTCFLLGLTTKTLQNWRRYGLKDKRKGSFRRVPHRLTQEEEDAFYKVATSSRFKDLTPEQIVAILAQEEAYIASEATLYRLLRKREALAHRQKSKKPCKPRPCITQVVTGPNQVWAWDITWLRTEVQGLFYYAYTILDLFDRTVVGWTLESSEADEHAAKLFAQTCRKHKVYPQIVHADNGHAMRGATLRAFLDNLGVNRSHSRPRVSNDNAFIESWHKTLKYTVGYPKYFESLDQARRWFADFVHWYNTSHLHSGLGYVTPAQRRSGEAEELYRQRQVGLQAAKLRNPSRWRQGKTKVWASDPVTFGYRPLDKSA